MRSDARRRREAIITAARTVFATGPETGTLEEVARVAKVGIATVYRNFKDKNALLIACIDELFGRVLEVQATTLAALDIDPETALHDYAHDLYELGLSPLFTSIPEETITEILPHYLATREKLSTANNLIVRHCQERGLISPQYDGPFFIAGLLQSTRPIPHTVLYDAQGLESKLIDVFLAGIRPRA